MEGMATRNQEASPSPSAAISSLGQAPFLATAGSESKHKLEAAAELRTYRAGETIFRQGDTADSVIFIRSGGVRIFVEQPDGHRIELRTLGPGEIFGELSVVGGGPRTANAQAATDVEVWSIDRETFGDVYRSDQQVAIEIAKITAPYVLADEDAGDVTVAGLSTRVARSVMDMSEAKAAVTVPELARMTGARVSNVIGVLEQFEAGGLIAIGSKGIEIVDPEQLGALAVH
jgi:CRP-like cAMP-binding protein